jgi:general secretion pathway protein N
MKQRGTSPSHTRKRWAVLACVLGLLLGMLVFAPAQWLALAVNRGSQGRVLLLNAQGTVWRGQADWLLSGGSGSQTQLGLPGGLRWQIQPRWDASGPGLQLVLVAPCCTPRPWLLQMGWSGGLTGRGTITLLDAQSTWPAGWLAGLGAPWNTVNLQGHVQVNTHGVSLPWPLPGKALAFQGSVQAQAFDLSSSLSTLRPLGSYEVNISSRAIELRTLKGDLALSGQGRWENGRLHFKGVAEASQDSASALSNLLNILGRRDGLRAHINLG